MNEINNTNGRLLWVDDEIDMLRAHVIFLEKKGYEVVKASSGNDALELCASESFDLILLDENMPGLSGLETLPRIKELNPNVPIVMVTKSEEENIMNQAIGSKIADYLIKPVNPNQVLLSLKKNIHKKEILTEVTQNSYREKFAQISMQIDDAHTWGDWIEIYKNLVFWELELTEIGSEMSEMLKMQKKEANNMFERFVRKNYQSWLNDSTDGPLLSHEIFKKNVFPLLNDGKNVFLLIFDNLRYDQWRVLSQDLGDLFTFNDELYYSILPTVTQYARNAICAGLLPLQIQQMYPDLWVEEDEDEGKNLNEGELIRTLMQRYRRKESVGYYKINDAQGADKLLQSWTHISSHQLNVIVINFIDIISHASNERQMVHELVGNEAAYRSITRSWFQHSGIKSLFEHIAATKANLIVTTDHGSIKVEDPIKVVGSRETNTNLRYKVGRNLNYNPKEVVEIKSPQQWGLPSPNLSSTYVVCGGNRFFAYPNKFNYYVTYYRNTFQHGGISMEEMLVPIISLESKN